ncbi:MAG: XrtA-associated tyrosine autokinase [Pseudomonadota bacterium]
MASDQQAARDADENRELSRVEERAKRSLVERLVDTMDDKLAPGLAKSGEASKPFPYEDLNSGRPAARKRPAPRRVADDEGDPSSTRNYVEINLGQLRREGYVTPGAQRSTIIEEFRSIKRPLLRNAVGALRTGGHLDHVMLVTSANENEGKTFVAINLAMSIASERGLNVLLVDSDVVKRDVPRRLNFRAKTGFMDMLTDPSIDLADVLIRTNIPNLTILPSGNHEQNTTELLAGPEMTVLMQDLATRYNDRIIIIDTPPVLMTTETPVLAGLVGQVVLVVEAERTTRTQVKRSVDLMSGCPNINLILNKVKDIHSGDYNYYGYYKSEDEPDAEAYPPEDAVKNG